MAQGSAKVVRLQDLDSWHEMMKESSKTEKVYVLDVFKDWCGPCTVMQFFFDQMVRPVMCLSSTESPFFTSLFLLVL